MIRVVRLISWPGRPIGLCRKLGWPGHGEEPFVTIVGGGRCVVTANSLFAYRLAGIAGLGLAAVGYGR
jgi:hypothetical protein